METIEVLKAARELISNPDHWCQNNYAKNYNGTPTYVEDPNATRFCGLGAIRKIAGTHSPKRYASVDALKDAALELFNMDAVDVNDRMMHSDILKVFDKAIEDEHQRANEATCQPGA